MPQSERKQLEKTGHPLKLTEHELRKRKYKDRISDFKKTYEAAKSQNLKALDAISNLDQVEDPAD